MTSDGLSFKFDENRFQAHESAPMTESSEDYLEAILVIRSERGACRNVDIAERLGVSKPSVTKALGNLARRGLAEVVDRDVRLTDAGKLLAKETLSKHRFFERLLKESGVDAETASKEACRMEHCLSEESFRKLADHLAGGRMPVFGARRPLVPELRPAGRSARRERQREAAG